MLFINNIGKLRHTAELRNHITHIHISFIIFTTADAGPRTPLRHRQTPLRHYTTPSPRKIQILHKLGDYQYERKLYMLVLARFRSGDNMSEAFRSTGVRKTTFYERRYIVELMETEPELFQELVQAEGSATELNKLCRDHLTVFPQIQKLQYLRNIGRLLP